MSKSIVRAACGLLILLVVIAGLAGCSNRIPEPEYASQMTESTAQAMSDGDYAAFAQYLSPEARAVMTEDIFNQASPLIKSIIGDYIDKEFWKAQPSNEDTAVYYKARFTEEPDGVTISVLFTEIDGEIYISGFLFDSPKLRGE
ncbi:hypothetical protein ES703_01304 [subsurface metagenome]